MKLLRTIRFDASDDHVYAAAAGPDEWAVSGAFAFADLAPAAVAGKLKQAFANGFLGLESFGRSTFVSVAEADAEDLAACQDRLARHFVQVYGAPDMASALGAARDELAFVEELCREAVSNTIFTVRRRFRDDGTIGEEFRTIRAPSDKPLHTRVWQVVADEDGDGVEIKQD